jgi:hypothetical protein
MHWSAPRCVPARNQILDRFTPSGDGAQSWHSQFTYKALCVVA